MVLLISAPFCLSATIDVQRTNLYAEHNKVKEERQSKKHSKQQQNNTVCYMTMHAI